MNNDDHIKMRRVWCAINALRRADGMNEIADALKRFTRDMEEDAWAILNKIRDQAEREPDPAVIRRFLDGDAPPAAGAGAPAPPPARKLRFPRRDTAFTNLMNIACYRYMRDDEARTLRGDKRRLPLPYGVEDTASLRMKIENYRWAHTHMVRGYGTEDKQWATKTIRFFYDFDPTDEELDEAAAHYTANPQ